MSKRTTKKYLTPEQLEEELERKRNYAEVMERENEQMKRQLEMMSSQTRHANSQQWTTEQVAAAHADMLQTALKGVSLISKFLKYFFQ